MKNVLVTGGAGYIGSHVCKCLFNNGFLPIVLDNLILGHKWSVKWGPLEVGSTIDMNCLDQVFSKYNFDGVIHLAALSNVAESYIKTEEYYENNLVGTLNLLKTMVKFNVKKIVFSSTCSVYGIPKIIPIPETHNTNPINPYGESKYASEKMIDYFSLAYDIDFISLRYFNVSGSDKDYEIGEAHSPETHIIPLALEVASGRSTHFEINGGDYETSDGTCIRDYIHVIDLSYAHLLALKKVFNYKASEFINLGGAKGSSVKEIISLVKKITGKKLNHKFSKRRKGDPPILIAKILKAKNYLGWQPKNSNISEIINDSWLWYKKYHQL